MNDIMGGPPRMSRKQFEAASLLLLQGTFRQLWVNGHSAAAGVGNPSGLPGSGGGRLALNLFKAPLRGNPLGGAVLSLEGVEVDPSGGGLTNVNTGVGGYARVLKDYGPAGQSTIFGPTNAAAGSISKSAASFAVNATLLPFEQTFTPPTINGKAITAPAAPMIIQVDDELMFVTAVDAGNYNTVRTFTVTRGAYGTTASAHAADTPVIQIKPRKALYATTGYQSSRPYAMWSIQGNNVGQTLPYIWYDLNDFFMHCSTSFGGMTLTGNSIANYPATLRAYISTYRRVISRIKSAYVIPSPYFRAAAEAVSSLPSGMAGMYSAAGVAGNIGGWANAQSLELYYLRKSTLGYMASNTVGDFLEYNGPSDLSQDQAVVFGGIVSNGESALLTFTVDGTVVGTIDTSQVAPPSINTSCAWSFRFTEAVLQAHGMSLKNTAHRYRVTLTTKTAGTYVFKMDSIDIESGHQLPILVAGGFRPTDAYGGGSTNNFYSDLPDRNTKIDQIIASVDALRDEFVPYSGLPNTVRKIDVDRALGVDPALRFGDQLHPNSDGYNAVAYEAYRATVDFALEARDAGALMGA